MRAIILAAGKGTRISRYLSGKPKCAVDIGEESLIEYTVNLLLKKNIQDIVMVVGYHSETIKNILQQYNIKYVINPFYDVTNSIASIWFAKDYLSENKDLLIMNGDVFIEESLLDNILLNDKSPVLFADSSRKECADYKFKYENGILKKYGKELYGEDISGEYIGIGRINKEFVREFVSQLEYMISKQNHSVWWENVLYEMSSQRPIYIEEIGNKFWAEVDYIEDYERILSFRGYSIDFSVNVHKNNIEDEEKNSAIR